MKFDDGAGEEEGGAIRKPRKKSPKRDEKIEQALATKVGGRMKFYDAQHKYMFNKLSGRGARSDTAQCRQMMQSIMENYHPSFWNSYVAGKVKDVSRFENDHLTSYKKQAAQRVESRPDVVDVGGSLNPLSYSENGFLMSHNPEFHSHYEVI